MDEKQTQETLTLHMDGLPSDAGDVRLAVFTEKLYALRLALQKTDEYLYDGDGESKMDFLVADLSHQSPAKISIRAQPQDASLQHQQEIFKYFSDLLAEITSSKYRTVSTSHYVLDCVKELAIGVGKRYAGMWFSYAGEVVARVTPETIAHLDDLLAKQYTSFGAVKGRVEKYNSHSDSKNFHLYPAIGRRIKCVFSEDQIDATGEAVNKNVIVHGLLKYQAGDFSPYEVIVYRIERIEPDESLQSLSGLFGIAKGASGDQSSVDLIKNTRNEWH